MTPQELAERRAFDLRVLSDMRCQSFDFEAYRTMADLSRRRSAVTSPEAGATVTKYRWIFRIPTHISQHDFAPVTEIGVNTDVADYPRAVPATWILSSHVPWSPHFMQDAPVCIGPELWEPRGGYITLGELAISIAHMLNWDEKGRGPGYVGWNGAAVRYHKTRYGNRPINPDLGYPALPSWLSGEQAAEPVFQIVNAGVRAEPGFQVHS